MEFLEFFNSIEESKRIEFLKELLLKNSNLKNQFIEYFSVKKSASTTLTYIDILELSYALWKDISEIDIDGYIEDNYLYCEDDFSEAVEECIDDVYQPYLKTMYSFLNSGRYSDAINTLLAIYEVKLMKPPTIEDNYFAVCEDIDYYIDSMTTSVIEEFAKELKEKILSNETTILLVKMFFEQIAKLQENGSHRVNDFNISDFLPFFEAIISTTESAKVVLEQIEKNSIENAHKVVLYCADVLKNQTLYLTTAKKYYKKDEEIALKLLQKYKELNMQDELAEIASNLLRKKDALNYTQFVIENIDKSKYQELYLKALKIYIKGNYSIEYYKILREYLTKTERLKFIETFKNSFKEVFYVKMLEIEKEYNLILSYVQKNISSFYLSDLIKPIVNIYPKEVFEIVKIKADKCVKEKNRGSYKKASSLLKLMLGINEVESELKKYVLKLYNHKPTLPALRDELRKAKLIAGYK